jgi:hypothetical protein
VFVEYEVPLRTASETNIREHWTARHKRRKAQRKLAFVLTHRAMFKQEVTYPLTVTMVRVGKRLMNDDNLQSSFKAIRDGIADALQIDDADERILWEYCQGTGRLYTTIIKIEWMD